MHEFQRITRLPPYVFAVVDELKLAARRRGEDIIDFGMGNPDLPTPPHIVEKLVEAAANPRNHRYSASRGISKLRDAMKAGVPQPLNTKDLLAALKTLKPTTREWFSTARNYAIYSNQGGIYDDVLKYLKL